MNERWPEDEGGPYASLALRCYAWVSVLGFVAGTAWMFGAFREAPRLRAVPAVARPAVSPSVQRAPARDATVVQRPLAEPPRQRARDPRR